MLEVPQGSRSSIAINACNLSVHCNRELVAINYLKLKATGFGFGFFVWLAGVLFWVFLKETYYEFDAPLSKHPKLCVLSHFSIKILQKDQILLWGNDVMKSKVCILLAELNFT